MKGRSISLFNFNVFDEFLSGTKYGVFIDDTGSPGLKVTSSSLHPERKTWVGVIVRPPQMPEVFEQFHEVIEELKTLTGAEEFHFADIYGGKGEFKGIDLKKRLGLFRFMTKIFKMYRFPVFVKTFNPDTLAALHSKARFPKRICPFNLFKQEDLALLFLLIRIKWYIEKNRAAPGITARVFVDEGYKKHGVAILIPKWVSMFEDGQICFARSSETYPLQLADFAAYVLNRSQLILDKIRSGRKISSLDVKFLVSPLPLLGTIKT